MVAVATGDVSPHAVQGTGNANSQVTAFTLFRTGEGYYNTSGLTCLMTLYPLRRLRSTGYLNFFRFTARTRLQTFDNVEPHDDFYER